MGKEKIVDVAVEAAKVSPPAYVVGKSLAEGWTMTHTATALTIAYVVLQAAYLIWKWRNESEDRRRLLSRSEGATP